MKILLFAGTSEGRSLCEGLAERGHAVTVCVATDYGAESMGALPAGAELLTGRLEQGAMEKLMAEGGYALCVDATHPYAAVVTANIRAAAEKTGLRLLRVVRPETALEGFVTVASAREAAEKLCGLEGPVLLTTGAKELDVYTAVPGFRERLYPRVLPSVESVGRCADLGYEEKRVIAMQGPFSRELNEAIIRQFGIKVLVTKESGRAGGFAEKVEAARACGCTLVVIRRPEKETGVDADEALRLIDSMQKEWATT